MVRIDEQYLQSRSDFLLELWVHMSDQGADFFRRPQLARRHFRPQAPSTFSPEHLF